MRIIIRAYIISLLLLLVYVVVVVVVVCVGRKAQISINAKRERKKR